MVADIYIYYYFIMENEKIIAAHISLYKIFVIIHIEK